MNINELKKEDIKYLKNDGYVIASVDRIGNILAIYKTVKDAQKDIANCHDYVVL